jgi:hypothetical protein
MTKFYFWINFLFSSLELITEYIYNNKLFVCEQEKVFGLQRTFTPKNRQSRAPTFIEMKGILSDISDSVSAKSSFIPIKEDNIINEVSNGKRTSFFSQQGEHIEEEDYIYADNSITDVKNLNDLFSQIKYNPDINKLLYGLNDIAFKRNVPEFDKKNLTVNFSKMELDKFENGKKVQDEFRVSLNFSLLD